MAEFVIIPDTSSDMTKELRERFGVPDYLRGLVYFPDGRTEYADLDWERYDPTWFYESMSDKKTLYKTACAPAGEIMQVYENQLKQGKDVLGITLSSALSGTYQTCEMVKKELLERYPERNIVIVDSLRYSGAIAVMVAMAARMKEQGATLEQTAQYLEQNKHCVHQIGPMDDLFFLVKTGRISNFKAFFGTLVGVNPMADFNRKGLAEVLVKFKGKKAALEGALEYMKQTIVDPHDQIIFISHSNRPQVAGAYKQMIMDIIAPKEVIVVSVGMSCGASVGPGLCAAYYVGREISPDNVAEKQLMNEILMKSKKG